MTSTKKLLENDLGNEAADDALAAAAAADAHRHLSGERRIDLPPDLPDLPHNQTRQSEKFRIPDEARRSTVPPEEVEIGKETRRVEIPESIKQLSLPTPGRAMDVSEVAALIEKGMAEQERELPKTPPIVLPPAPRIPTVEVKEPPPQTVLATVKVGRRRFSPLLIKLREIASAFLLFVALLALSLAILRAIVLVMFH